MIIAFAAAAFLAAMWLLLKYLIESGREYMIDRKGLWARMESVLVGAIGMLLGTMFFGAMAGIFYFAGSWILSLPEVVQTESLEPPRWLASVTWAKPAMMIMGVWSGIGGGHMLLYIAGISNIPQELYEAAEIDGAGRWAKFKYVTWPQLRPTTFFIVIMSMMGGLKGGFNAARVLTGGGPAGSTTTLSYYIYSRGFEQLEMGFACAVAWVLFVIIFVITALNWRYGKGGDSHTAPLKKRDTC